MTDRRLAPKVAARDSVTPDLGEAGSHAGIVCTSARCDHPKRRYSCSTAGKIRTRDGVRTYTIPHVDCVYAGIGDKCAACCVPGASGVGGGRTWAPSLEGPSGVVELLPSVADLRGRR